ncbi:hypothetical protein B0J11DRAFT_594918 [Dendryphion nanum]|uniref:Uncharacterized protein n=1 Tax=Dendryphion nanum TaxID=256645 RepID=A0A9P9D7X4_9PLEO|nr:hypothetical protein B0J11DRAFT_594918 [Dendryphion nanum]
MGAFGDNSIPTLTDWPTGEGRGRRRREQRWRDQDAPPRKYLHSRPQFNGINGVRRAKPAGPHCVARRPPGKRTCVGGLCKELLADLHTTHAPHRTRFWRCSLHPWLQTLAPIIDGQMQVDPLSQGRRDGSNRSSVADSTSMRTRRHCDPSMIAHASRGLSMEWLELRAGEMPPAVLASPWCRVLVAKMMSTVRAARRPPPPPPSAYAAWQQGSRWMLSGGTLCLSRRRRGAPLVAWVAGGGRGGRIMIMIGRASERRALVVHMPGGSRWGCPLGARGCSWCVVGFVVGFVVGAQRGAWHTLGLVA